MRLDAQSLETAANARDELLAIGRIATPQPSRGGEWDGFYSLTKPERARIVRNWTTPEGIPVDVATEAAGGWDRWLELSRIADSPSQARAPANRGKLHAIPSLGGIGLRHLLAELDEVATLEHDAPALDLLGLSEVADTLGRSLRTVSSWHRRGQMPQAVELRCGPVWERGAILEWSRDKGITSGHAPEETF